MHKDLPVAVHIFFFRQSQVLLARRFNTGYEDGNYSVVAGHLEGGETVRQAAVREISEEVGVAVRPEDLQFVGVMHRRTEHERIDFFLVATDWQGRFENKEPHKCSELRWFPANALPANLVPYVRQGLENYFAGVWFEEFGC